MRKVLGAIISFGGGTLVFGAEVGPSDAEANICKWVALGWPGTTSNCLQGATTFQIWSVAAAMIVGGAIWGFWPQIAKIWAHWRHSIRRRTIPATALPDGPSTNPYMTAYEVIHYIADDSKWGVGIRNSAPVQSGPLNWARMPLFEAQAEFKRIAEQGGINAIGRLDGAGLHVPIPGTYWTSATLDPFSRNNREISTAIPAVPNPDSIPTYRDVRIARSDVERAWPRYLPGDSLARLEFVFSANDSRFVVDEFFTWQDGRQAPRIRRWRLGLKNTSSTKSVDHISIRSQTDWFTNEVVVTSYELRHRHPPRPPVICEFDTLEPGAMEIIDLFGMECYPSRSHGTLSKTLELTLEARARDAPTVFITFLYEPTDPFGTLKEKPQS